MSYTTGPWRVGDKNGYNANAIFHAEPTRYEGEEGSVCAVYGIPLNTTLQKVIASGRYEQGLANARLIASAPQLLEALKLFLPVLEDLEGSPEYWDIFTKGTGIATLNSYRAAIRAAEGEE